MKIGFSYSRCVRDIAEGRVDIQDVLVIIARTDFDPNDDGQWANIWQGYRQHHGLSAPEWAHTTDTDENTYRRISIDLWQMGKLHQPRKFGARASRSPHTWVDTGPIGVEHRPQAVQDAWKQYQVLASLAQNAHQFHDNF